MFIKLPMQSSYPVFGEKMHSKKIQAKVREHAIIWKEVDKMLEKIENKHGKKQY